MEATTATRRSTTAGAGAGTGNAISQEDNTSPLAHVATGAVLIRQPAASLSTHPLVSALSAAYVLGVLYLPRRILSLLLSPALVSALLLLATLLYFDSPSRQDHRQSRSPELRQHFHSEERRRRRQEQHQPRAFPQPAATPDTDPNSPAAVLCSAQKPLLLAEHHHFVEWPRWGPLEVIYEEYEGGEEEEEEEEEDVGHPPPWPASGRSPGMERTALRCYSDDSDGDDDSGSYSVGGSSPAWDLPEDLFFRLDLEEEGLIEIPLEEDNLIEIDISARR